MPRPTSNFVPSLDDKYRFTFVPWAESVLPESEREPIFARVAESEVVETPPLAVKRPVVVTVLLNEAAPDTVRVPVERAAIVSEELVEMSAPLSCLIENVAEDPESTSTFPSRV